MKDLMVDGSCASECGELLSNLFGIVFGHIDEQALLRRGLGDVGATASGERSTRSLAPSLARSHAR